MDTKDKSTGEEVKSQLFYLLSRAGTTLTVKWVAQCSGKDISRSMAADMLSDS